MDWENPAIVLGLQDYNGEMLLMTVLTRDHGTKKGIIRSTKKNKPALSHGTIVQVKWHARLEAHLGTFTIQSHEIIAQFVYHERKKLLALLSICELFRLCLPEKEPQSLLYTQLEDFLYALRFHNPLWINLLVALELELLSKVGFGLDLEKCAATGSTKDLVYLSPRTGKAVSFIPGEPYKDKLFPMPKLFLNPSERVDNKDLALAFRITRYFFMKNVFITRQNQFPSTRQALEATLDI